MGVGGVAASIAGVELAMAQSFPMPCSTGAAGTNLAAGALMLASAASLNGMASNAAKDHRAKSSELRTLMAEFDKFHQNGGIDQFAGPTPPSLGAMTQSIENNALSNGNVAQDFSNNSLEGLTTESATSTGETCISSNGKPNLGCSCSSSNSCLNVGLDFALNGTSADIQAQKAQINSLNAKTSAGNLTNSFNSLSAGRKTLADFRKENIKLADKRIKAGLSAIEDFNESADQNGLAKIDVTPSVFNQVASTGSDYSLPTDSSDGASVTSEKDGSNAAAVDVASSSNGKKAFQRPLAFKKEKIDGDMDFLFDEGDPSENLRSLASAGEPELDEELAANMATDSDSGPLTSGSFLGSKEVIQNRNSNLFRMISIRYRRKFFSKKR
jgi:hypothetical protein